MHSRCNIQWTEHWDTPDLQAVAAARLQPVLAQDDDGLKQGQQLIAHAAAVHNSRLAADATPRHYVAFIQLCSKLYTSKRDELVKQQNFLKVNCIHGVQASRFVKASCLDHMFGLNRGADC